jgi:hypothetical protein
VPILPIASMTRPRFGDAGGRASVRGIEPRPVLAQLRFRPGPTLEKPEEASGALALEAFLHVLRGHHRIVVLGDDSL